MKNYYVGRSYRYPGQNTVYTVLGISAGTTIRFKCGHWCTDNVFLDLIDVETRIQNYKFNSMPKLNKPRGFEASKETDSVTMSGKIYEIANLLKSGMVNQSTILIDVDDTWQEINVLNLGADNSDLKSFAAHVDIHGLKLSDFGLTEKKPTIDYDLKHDDFMALQEKFPMFSYIKISKLDKYVRESGGKYGMYQIKQDLHMLSERGITIDDFIANTEQSKNDIINNKKPNLNMTKTANAETQNRIIELTSYGMVEQPDGSYIGHGFSVSAQAIELDAPEAWSEFIAKIADVFEDASKAVETHAAVPVEKTATETPAAETPTKKPISLSVISGLDPSRIIELKGLKEAQEAVVKANPIITPTDKKTRDEAQKSVQALLKASTAIDGKTGILANFVTHANQFITMGKNYLTPLAKITRDQHDKQKALVTAWDAAEEIRVQNENKAKLTKIKERTDKLFAVPFFFNGSLYSIGTHYVMPSDIEKWTDEEFDAAVKKGEELLQAEKSVEDVKNDAIRNAAETLRQYNPEAADQILISAGLMEAKPVEETPAETVGTTKTANTAPTSISPPITPQTESPAKTATSTASATKTVSRFNPSTEYVLPDPSNDVVNNFDMQHFGLINDQPINPAFVKCRAYFIEGTRQAAIEVEKILNGEKVVNGLKQSERIAKLVNVLKSAV